MRASVFHEILRQLNRGENSRLMAEVDGKRYVRKFLTNDRLIILGGGHVGLALSRMAALLDFSVTIVDDRPAFANDQRFPDADEVICDSFENAINRLCIRDTDYVCVLTRGHRWDKDCIKMILGGTMPRYLGMIGSCRRVAGLRDDLLEIGYPAERLDQLHAPIGLRIGAQTPSEIALSICAEMISVKRMDHQKSDDNTLFATNTDIQLLTFLANSESPRALLLVLSSDGSTPVDSGAIMGIDPIGGSFGTIGGGCSEAAAIAKARRIIGTGERAVIEIDMSNEVAAENGMVCGGCMTVLIEDIT
ncbi:MAG: XdhC family protein [Ruminococcus sp.]|nr:XdhC family protein [Ruminococcus sp.]